MTFDPYEDCEDCPTFDPDKPYEVEEDTEPFANCGDICAGPTSLTYPILINEDYLNIKSFSLISGHFNSGVYSNGLPEKMEIKDFDVTAGVFRIGLIEYEDGESEDLEIKTFTLDSGVFRISLVEYSNGETEDMEIKNFTLTAGVFRVGLIEYTNGETEDMEIKDFDLTGGSHAVP